MRKSIITAFLSVAYLCPSCWATIINVPDDYLTIQLGINASSDSDTVLVQPDTYVENINFNNHSIVLGSLFLTTGDTSYISTTIIDGNASGTVILIDGSEDSTTTVTGFTIQNGSATHGGGIYFNGFGATFSNLIVNDNSASQQGGGIYLLPYYSAQNVNIINCTISDNSSGSEGGGIYSHLGSNCVINMSGCVIENNSAVGKGGGFYSSTASEISNSTFSGNTVTGNADYDLGGGFFGENKIFTIDGCTFVENTAEKGGGLALRNILDEATIENCYFDGNTALASDGQGGAITLDDDLNEVVNNNCRIINCTIKNNISVYGGGIYVGDGRNIMIDHCLIAGNSATHASGIDIFGSQNDSLVIANCTVSNNHSFGNLGAIRIRSSCFIRNCIVSGNVSDGTNGGIYYAGVAVTEYNDIFNNYPVNFAGSYPSGLGELVDVNANGDSCDVYYNIFSDPMFVEPDSSDYHLLLGSPCIDAGDPSSPYDPDSTIADMGAYYYNQLTNIDDDLSRPIEFILSQNYPNPFNASTVIRYSLSEQSEVNIEIYDILGRRVETISEGDQQAGEHQITWDAINEPSGVYFYQIQTGDFLNTKKMLLVK